MVDIYHCWKDNLLIDYTHLLRLHQSWRANRHPQRATLEALHGYDTKNAAHLLRLDRMGIEILRRELAEAHLRTGGVGPDDPVTAATDPIHLAWLRLLAGRRDARAAGLAERIIRSAEAGGRHGTLLRALPGAAQLTAGDLRSARRYLDRALALAEPEGAIRPFLDEGPARQAALVRIQIST